MSRPSLTLERLRKVSFPLKVITAAMRWNCDKDKAYHELWKAKDKGYVTLEAHGLYWPTKKLVEAWKE